MASQESGTARIKDFVSHGRKDTFLAKVLALQAKSARTRITLYDLLTQVEPEGLDDTAQFPTERWLLYKGPLKATQFRETFSATAMPELRLGELTGVPRLVEEAKAWTLEPYLLGWLQQRRRIPNGMRRVHVEAFLRMMAAWALAYPRLAALGASPRVPAFASGVVRQLAGTGEAAVENERILHDVVEQMMVLVNAGGKGSETPGAIVQRLRVKLAGLALDEDDLERETSRFVASIGQFMRLATRSTDITVHASTLIPVLKHALDVLQSQQAAEQGEDLT